MARIVLASILSAIIAGSPFPPAAAQQSQPERQARIIVVGEGSVSAVPDSAPITSGVTTRAKTVKEAVEANSKLMAAIMATLVDAGIAQKDIQTARFSVSPVYTTPAPNTEQKLTGFSVSNQVSVTIRQIEKAGDILDRVVAAGATNIGNLVFLHSDTAKLIDQAREDAVANARHKAELYARASGVQLGPVVWITEDSGYSPPVPMKVARMAVPISSGEDKLHVQITVGFGIAQ